MTDEMKIAQACRVYLTLCNAIERMDWNYTKKEEILAVEFSVTGEDLPMPFHLLVDAQRQLVRLSSIIPFSMCEEKRLEGAVATIAANYGMADGNFDYDLCDGTIIFRMTASFRESMISESMFHYMISCTCQTVDQYNDRFFALNKGLITLADFLEKRG